MTPPRGRWTAGTSCRAAAAGLRGALRGNRKLPALLRAKASHGGQISVNIGAFNLDLALPDFCLG
jgi:hypothetical protein